MVVLVVVVLVVAAVLVVVVVGADLEARLGLMMWTIGRLVRSLLLLDLPISVPVFAIPAWSLIVGREGIRRVRLSSGRRGQGWCWIRLEAMVW